MGDQERLEEPLLRELQEMRQRTGVLEAANAELERAAEDLRETVTRLNLALESSKLKDAHERLQAINRIGETAGSSLDLEEVLLHILDGTLQAVGASAGMVFLRDSHTKCLTWGASRGLSETFVDSYRDRSIRPGEGLTGRIAETGEPIHVREDSSNDPRIARRVVEEGGFHSFIGVPIRAAEEVVAVMNVVTRPPQTLEESEIPLILAIGAHVGWAVHNANLFSQRQRATEALRKAREELERRVQKRTAELAEANAALKRQIVERKQATDLIQAQRDLAVALNAVSKLDEALDLCMDAAMAVSGMDSAGVYLVDPKTGVDLVAHKGLSEEFVERTNHFGRESNIAQLVVAGEPTYVRPHELPLPVGAICTQDGMTCMAVLPVRHGGQVVACLNLASHSLDRVPSDACHAVEAIAAQIGGAIVRIKAGESQRTAEEHLAAEQRFLQELLDLQERERKLVSLEIHDGVVQYLVSAKMYLETSCREVESKGGAVPEAQTLAVGLLGRGIAEARRVMGALRPMILDERGLVDAIDYLIAEEEERGGLSVRFEHDAPFHRLSPILEGSVFRIVQEALTNARRHSQSKTVEISLSQENGLLLEIRDHGKGFNPDEVPEDRFGIRGIRERARLFGGNAVVKSAPGKGTRITVTFPLEREPSGKTKPIL